MMIIVLAWCKNSVSVHVNNTFILSFDVWKTYLETIVFCRNTACLMHGCECFNKRYNNIIFFFKFKMFVVYSLCFLTWQRKPSVYLFNPPLTLYNSLLAFMLWLFSLQSKAISSSSLSFSQISSSVQCDTNACRLSKLCRRHDECSYGNHTNKHHHHADQLCGQKINIIYSLVVCIICWFWCISSQFEDGLNQSNNYFLRGPSEQTTNGKECKKVLWMWILGIYFDTFFMWAFTTTWINLLRRHNSLTCNLT